MKSLNAVMVYAKLVKRVDIALKIAANVPHQFAEV